MYIKKSKNVPSPTDFKIRTTLTRLSISAHSTVGGFVKIYIRKLLEGFMAELIL